jgi:hypothetical protein
MQDLLFGTANIACRTMQMRAKALEVVEDASKRQCPLDSVAFANYQCWNMFVLFTALSRIQVAVAQSNGTSRTSI